MSRLIALNKPFDVLSQFTDKGLEGSKRRTLSDFVAVPAVYPAGRLDRDSEGLLLLTDDGKLQAQISNPQNKMPKVYVAQVEGEITEDALDQLRKGVTLKDGLTRPARAKRIDVPDWLWPRTPPVRFRKNVPDCWIELTICEGKNRQVRRMTAHVGFPTLRLIRHSIGPYTLDGIESGKWRDEIPQTSTKPSRPILKVNVSKRGRK